MNKTISLLNQRINNTKKGIDHEVSKQTIKKHLKEIRDIFLIERNIILRNLNESQEKYTLDITELNQEYSKLKKAFDNLAIDYIKIKYGI